ncbi:MAG TPA: hypothetical protein VIW94_03085 [Acidimicrobiia bacterium]
MTTGEFVPTESGFAVHAANIAEDGMTVGGSAPLSVKRSDLIG